MEITLSIDEKTFEKLQLRSEEQGFDQPEEYGSKILKVVLEELEPDKDEEVQSRLRDLGYIN